MLAEKYWCTRPIFSKGTGLGLSSVHGLAAQSNGLFELASELGKRTVASLWLPAAKVTNESNNAPAQSNISTQLTPLKILLVDDEIRVRMGTVHMLQDIVHHVIQASSARQTMQVIEIETDIDLLLTDYAMPDMSGDGLALAARKIPPELKLLLVTDYASSDKEWAIDMPRLEKSFGQDDLASAISKASAALNPA